MKAIYIPMIFDPDKDLDSLNEKIKNYHSIIHKEYVNNMNMSGALSGPKGQIIIVDTYFEE